MQLTDADLLETVLEANAEPPIQFYFDMVRIHAADDSVIYLRLEDIVCITAAPAREVELDDGKVWRETAGIFTRVSEGGLAVFGSVDEIGGIFAREFERRRLERLGYQVETVVDSDEGANGA